MRYLLTLLLCASWLVRLPSSPSAELLSDEDKIVAADEQTLKDHGIASTGPELLDFFRKRTISPADQARWQATVRRLGDESFAIREKASADLASMGRPALHFLRPALNDADLEIARRAERCVRQIEEGREVAVAVSAARLITVRRPPGAAKIVLNYLPTADDEFLEMELLTSLKFLAKAAGRADPSLLDALNDGAPLRRGAAAYVVGEVGDEEARTTVRSLLNDKDPLVRLRAAQGLIAGKDKAALPTLVALLDLGPSTVAWRAEELLSQIAGDGAPAFPLGSSDATGTRECREAWETWWLKKGPQLDLAKLQMAKRQFGFTLVAVYDGYGGKGKVLEVGVDGRPRWQIDDVQGPVDAQWLPGDRVLIAESRGQRITERMIDGKILWERKLAASPVNCRRLPNGNIFVATFEEIREFTAAGKDEYVIKPARQVYSAQKLRNGHIVYLAKDGTLVEIDDKGKELSTFAACDAPVGLVRFDVLEGGRYLVPQQTKGKVVEFDHSGKTIWQGGIPNSRFVSRLPNGNTLSCGHNGDHRVIEVNRAGKIVWELKLEGLAFVAYRR